MKNNKLKVFSLMIVLIFCLSVFSACTPPIVQFNYEELTNEIISVELLNYNGERKKVKTINEVAPFNINNSEEKEILSNIDTNFFDNISKIEFWDIKTVSVKIPYEPIGYCIRLNYKNSDFCIIFCATKKDSDGYSGMLKYNSANVCIDAFGYVFNSQKFYDILDNYFNISANEL